MGAFWKIFSVARFPNKKICDIFFLKSFIITTPAMIAFIYEKLVDIVGWFLNLFEKHTGKFNFLYNFAALEKLDWDIYQNWTHCTGFPIEEKIAENNSLLH